MTFQINGEKINSDNYPYVIAEAGINHNGSVDRALEMVEVAAQSGANAIKFQTFKAVDFCGDPKQMFTYRSKGVEVTEPMLDMFTRNQLPDHAWQEIKNHSLRHNITFFSTPQNISDLDLLQKVGVPAVKIGSDDLTNLPLIRHFSAQGLPLILSTGMSNLAEIDDALVAAGWYTGNQVAVMVCTSQYPTPAKDVNISRVSTLRNAFPGLIVGFSDHTGNDIAATMAISLGAAIFEKHFTLDHDDEGPDHWFSLTPNELKDWVHSIREAYIAKGSGKIEPSEEEIKMRVLARRSAVACVEIPAGSRITKNAFNLRRPGSGIPPKFAELIIGRIAARDIAKNELISWTDLE